MTNLSDLPFHIEEWSRDDKHIVEVMAMAVAIPIAHAAFDAACELRPNVTVRLRHGIRVIRERKADV